MNINSAPACQSAINVDNNSREVVYNRGDAVYLIYMADKGGLQLLPETRKKIDVKVPGENKLISIGAGLVVLVLALYAGLWWYSSSLSDQIAQADSQLMALEQQRDKKTEENLLTLSKQLAITNQVLGKHTYWSTGLSKIESAVQNSVQFRSFSGILGEEGFNVRALSDNYATLAKQLAAFVADDGVKDVTLGGVSVLTSGKLDFNAKIKFDPLKFLKKQ